MLPHLPLWQVTVPRRRAGGPGAANARCSDAYAASHQACDASARASRNEAAKAANR